MESRFQEDIMHILLKTNYRRIISGKNSAIDDYVVHKDFPLFIVNMIEFKYIGEKQQCNLTPKQQDILFMQENKELGKRFLLIVSVENEETQEAILKNINQKGVKIILMKNSAINNPFLKENTLNFCNIQFKDPVVQELIKNGEIRFFKSKNLLVDGLKVILDENHKENLSKLFPNEKIKLVISGFFIEVSVILQNYEFRNRMSLSVKNSLKKEIEQININLNYYGINSDRLREDYDYLISQLDQCSKHDTFELNYVLPDFSSFRNSVYLFKRNVFDALNVKTIKS